MAQNAGRGKQAKECSEKGGQKLRHFWTGMTFEVDVSPLTQRFIAFTLGSPFLRLEASMKNAAVGFRVHSGWSALVAVSLGGREPVVLRRGRVELVEAFPREFKQPYHSAEKMPFEEGREFISNVKKEAERLACRALQEAQAELERDGKHLVGCGLLLASGRPLPDLQTILASHALIHTAEGELFREALAGACTRCELQVFRVREKQVVGEAARMFRTTEAAVLKRVTELGRPLSSPWARDEKFAALAAWLALHENGKPKAPAKRHNATQAP
jgi:hypothetical protein